jgi:hypothetical protein
LIAQALYLFISLLSRIISPKKSATFWDYALTLSRFGLLSAAPDRQVPERLIGLISPDMRERKPCQAKNF